MAKRLREIVDKVESKRPENINPSIMIFAYFETNDDVANAVINHYLVEGGKSFDLGRGYKAAFNRACPLLSKSGQTRAQLVCPLSAKERHQLDHDPSAQVAGIVN